MHTIGPCLNLNLRSAMTAPTICKLWRWLKGETGCCQHTGSRRFFWWRSRANLDKELEVARKGVQSGMQVNLPRHHLSILGNVYCRATKTNTLNRVESLRLLLR
jgi:hypothetical protein